MTIEDLLAATGGPSRPPNQPEGGSDVTPLPGHGTSGVGAQPAPENVTAAQGAGSTGGGLTPGAQQVNDGSVHIGGVNRPDSSQGPAQRPTLSGIASLTAGQVNRPEGGAALMGEQPGAVNDPRLGADGTGTALNPALKAALTPRPGPFGEPSAK